MVDYPLLPTPRPTFDSRPSGPRRGPENIRGPSRNRQEQRLGPVFERLQRVFDSGRDPVSLQEDPTGIAPERALVFEVAGSIPDFHAAVRNVPGLHFLSDEEFPLEADEDFAEVDTRKGREGRDRIDRPMSGRLYLAMPDTRALEYLLSLWRRYQRGENARGRFRTWANVFDRLHALRGWGPIDRIPDDTVAYLEERISQAAPDELIRVEIELWYDESADDRTRAQQVFAETVLTANGSLVDGATIDPIGYIGRLVDLPAQAVQSLIQREEVHLTICDEVMVLRPQSAFDTSTEIEAMEFDQGSAPAREEFGQEPPIVAVFDGMPVQNHRLLANRLDIDDPDDLDALSIVEGRIHGTAIASLVVHGDRNVGGPPLSRIVYFRPVLYSPMGWAGFERPPEDRLMVDLIYRAVLRMKEGDSEGPATAPEVFIVNLSLGDESRPFTGPMSPWGRLLDFLAAKYQILFIVSAGNVKQALPVSRFSNWTDFEDADPADREAAILEALAKQQAYRTLLSPAEAVNVLTVGAWHEDGAPMQNGGFNIVPYTNGGGPNITSALGLGHRKVIKPDIFMPGGREAVAVSASGGGLSVRAAKAGRLFGVRAAAPDQSGQLNYETLISGTSAATALATRAAHQMFDALLDPGNGALLKDVDPDFYGVIIKAMLVHRAQWGCAGEKLEASWEPRGQGKHVARRDEIARLLGYGRPNVEEVLACAENRATMIGFGTISAQNTSCLYRVPLPPGLAGIREMRALTVTLAWFSPINYRHQAYRRAKLEIKPESPNDVLGVDRVAAQPSDKSTPRGSLLHERYIGERAVAFVDGDSLALRVFCRAQGGELDQTVGYGLAITMEAAEGIQVYEEIRQRLGIRAGTN